MKNNPDTNYEELLDSLKAAVKRKKSGAKCCQCGQPIWAAGSAVTGTDMCFTCITGEADDSDDYEVCDIEPKRSAPQSTLISKAGTEKKKPVSLKSTSKPHGKDQLWQEAKQKCRLNDDDIAIAKRMNISPKSLIKNIPSKSEPWKAPVKDWLRSLDEKARDKAEKKAKRKATVMRAKEQVPETQSAPKDSDAAKKNGK